MATQKKDKAKPKRPKVVFDIDTVVSLILDGKTYRYIADCIKVPLSTLHDNLSKSEHSARVREALLISADSYADKAEEVLLHAESDKNEIARAKELAQHYRWKSSKRNPQGYGDKIDVTSAGGKLEPTTIVWGGKEVQT